MYENKNCLVISSLKKSFPIDDISKINKDLEVISRVIIKYMISIQFLVAAGFFIFVQIALASPCTNPLSCFIYQQIIPFSHSFGLPPSGSLDVEAICSKSALSGFLSSMAGDGVSLRVYNINLYCLGQWYYLSPAGNRTVVSANGTISLNIVNMNVSGVFEILSYGGYPTSVTVTGFQVLSFTPSVNIYGGGSIGALLSSQSAFLAYEMSTALPPIISSMLSGFLTRHVNPFIGHKVIPALLNILQAQPGTVPALTGYVDWRTSALASYDLFYTNIPVAYLLSSLSSNTALGPLIMTMLLNYLTNGHGTLSVPFDLSMGITYAGQRNAIVLSFPSMSAAGISGFSGVSLLQLVPTSGSLLKSSFAASSMTVSIPLTATAFGVFTQAFKATVTLVNVTVTLQTLAALKWTRLKSMQLGRLLSSPYCLLSTLDDLAVASLELAAAVTSVDVVQLMPASTSPATPGFIGLADHLAQLIGFQFPTLTSGLLAGVAQGTMRTRINRLLRELVQYAGYYCPARHYPRGTGGVRQHIVWSQNRGMKFVAEIVNLLGPSNFVPLFALYAPTGSASYQILDNLYVTVNGLFNVDELSVLQPLSGAVQSHTLRHVLNIAEGSLVLASDSSASASKYVTVSFTDMLLTLDTVAMMRESTLLSMQVGNLSGWGCILGSFDALNVSSLLMDVGSGKVEIDLGILTLTVPNATAAINGILDESWMSELADILMLYLVNYGKGNCAGIQPAELYSRVGQTVTLTDDTNQHVAYV